MRKKSKIKRKKVKKEKEKRIEKKQEKEGVRGEDKYIDIYIELARTHKKRKRKRHFLHAEMGSGQSHSNDAVEAHLNKWDSAVRKFERMTTATRNAIERDRMSCCTGRPTGQRASTDDECLDASNHATLYMSQVSFGTSQNHTQHRQNQTSMENSLHVTGVGVSHMTVNNTSAMDVSMLASSTGLHQRPNRQQVQEIRKARISFFKSYETSKPEEVVQLEGCSHFGVAAVALSYLLGGKKGCEDRKKRVTVEDIFFAAHVPLQYLHSGEQSLSVMADIIRDFIDVDNRFKNEYSLSVMYLDIAPTIGQVELGGNDVGDRQTRMQLPEFTKVITHDCEEEMHLIRIVNYDPYVLDQETMIDAGDCEDDYNTALTASVRLNSTRLSANRHRKNNRGAYAAIVSVRNVVQLMVTLAEGVVGESMYVTLVEVPAAALFKAMTAVKPGARARGFIHIFRKDTVPVITHDVVQSMFTPELASGKVLGSTLQGMHAFATSMHISSHIIAVAWAMHLLGGVRVNSHGHGNGLPVSDIIRKMRLPAEVFIDSNLPLGEVFRYAREYVRITNRNYNVAVYPVLTKVLREDAVPTISVFDLETIIIDVINGNKDPEAPEHVMVIMYNASVAHNVLYISKLPQWCLLSGYDKETQTVLLIDAKSKKFMQTWRCSLERLHKAMTFNGYIVFSKSQNNTSNSKSNEGGGLCAWSSSSCTPDPGLVGAPRRISSTVQSHLELLRGQEKLVMEVNNESKMFCFPSLPLSSTMIALALTRLGVSTTFEDVIIELPFDISSLMIRFFTVEALAICLTTYVKKVGLAMDVQTYHTDKRCDGTYRMQKDDFKSLVEKSVEEENKILFVLFENEKILIFGDSHPFGCTGLVVGYNAKTESVTVIDSNPNSYFRTWSVPFEALYKALLDDEVKHRRRGCVLLTRRNLECDSQFPLMYSRDFSLHLLPVQNIFHVSPSPHFQALSVAFAQLGHFYSPEEIFYEAYLKTMDDQRRRGSQAFAWRDVDVSLSVINKQIDARFLAHVCRMFIDSRGSKKANQAQGVLKRVDSHRGGFGFSGGDATKDTGEADVIQVEVLDDVDLDELETILMDATRRDDNNSVLLLNYDTAKAHDVGQWGRSVALVKSYNPETKMVELFDGEYVVFGLLWTVDLATLIEIGDLQNEGRSPYGFVKMERVKSRTLPKRLALMRNPDLDEDESPAAGSSEFLTPPKNGLALRRNREFVTKFVADDVSNNV